MHQRWLAVILAVVGASLGMGCGDDDGLGGLGGLGGAAGAAGRSSGASGSGGRHGGVDAGAGSGAVGATAMVRVANLVPGVTFDAWGPDAEAKPVRIARNLQYAAISDYIDVPLNMLTHQPVFNLWRSGDVPEADKVFSLLLDDTHERVRIEVLELDAADQRATIILEPTGPDATSNLEYETLDETHADRGDPTQVNLHVAYHLFHITGGAVVAIGVVGQPCLIRDSVAVADVHSVAPGAFELAVYDLQDGGECGDMPPLAKLAINGAAGDNVLVVLYLDGTAVKMISAPIDP